MLDSSKQTNKTRFGTVKLHKPQSFPNQGQKASQQRIPLSPVWDNNFVLPFPLQIFLVWLAPTLSLLLSVFRLLVLLKAGQLKGELRCAVAQQNFSRSKEFWCLSYYHCPISLTSVILCILGYCSSVSLFSQVYFYIRSSSSGLHCTKHCSQKWLL